MQEDVADEVNSVLGKDEGLALVFVSRWNDKTISRPLEYRLCRIGRPFRVFGFGFPLHSRIALSFSVFRLHLVGVFHPVDLGSSLVAQVAFSTANSSRP